MFCPNINTPEWKALVEKHGEDKAYQIYANNEYEVPSVEKDRPKTLLDSLYGFFIPQGKTLQEINKNPELSAKVIDAIKKTFPDVVINKDGIIKEDGTFVPLKPGQKGMHVRNALHSMVAWANDAYLETPPHEYAHHYVDMFRNAPLVKKGIEKYGEEKLVEKIGRYYTEQYTAPGFKRWVRKFWNMLRRVFMTPNIKYELYRAFRENKQLTAKPSQGTNIVRLQQPYKRSNSSYTESEELNSVMGYMYSFENDEEINDRGEILKNHVTQGSIDILVNKTEPSKILNRAGDKSYELINLNDDIAHLKDIYRDSVQSLIDTDTDAKGNYKNVIGFDKNDTENGLARIKNILNSEYSKTNAITAYSLFFIAGKSEVAGKTELDFPWERFFGTPTPYDIRKVEEDGQWLGNKYIDIQKRLHRAKQEKSHLILLDNSGIELENAVKVLLSEINEASKKRENYWYNKGIVKKAPFLQKFIKGLSSLITKYQVNARLQTKFLSGKANSSLQKILYEEFNNARHRSLELKQEARKSYGKIINVTENIDGSYFYNQNNTIENFAETNSLYEIKNKKGQPLELTESELISLYLNLRMKKNSNVISDNGFVIQDKIEGRVAGEIQSISNDTMMEVKKIVEKNKRLKEIVENVDASLDSMYDVFNKAHIAETGVPLPKEEFYFPTQYGLKDEEDVRRSKKDIEFLGQRLEKKGNEKAPIRISDAYQVLNNYIDAVGHYAGYNLPIKNARKVISGLRKKLLADKKRPDYKEIKDLLDALTGNINNLEDNSLLYSSRSEKEVEAFFNKMMSNFSTSVLATNIPVKFKQPISYLAAANVIDVQYLKQAGWGVGTIAGIGYKEIFDQLKVKKIGANKSILPLEWRMDENNPVYRLIKKYSPILTERSEGSINPELGEVLMDSRIAQDSIRIPLTRHLRKLFGSKKTTDFEMSKNSLMSGIKAFDTATVISIWKAVELEAQDPNGPFANKDGTLMLNKNGTQQQKDEYYQHVARRTEQIVNETQPTFDLNNRSGAASSKSIYLRFLTMFGSARSKLAMLVIEGAVDLMNDPTKENQMLFLKRLTNVTVLSAMAAVTVDLIKQFTLGSGFDDPEDDVLPFVGYKMLSTTLGNFYGIGTLSDYVMSNLDDEPWRRDIQMPIEVVTEDLLDIVVNTAKGDVGKAAQRLIEGSFKVSGAPLYPYVTIKNITKRIND